jgi:hypothetical protein
VCQGVLLNQPLEVLFQLAGHCGRSTRALAVHQAVHPLVGKAVDPCAEGGRGKVQRVGNRLETLPFDDVADSLGTAEDPGFFGLVRKVSRVGRASSGKYYTNRMRSRHTMG